MVNGESPTTVFFGRLEQLGRVEMLGKVTGSMRVEITDGRKTEKKQITVRRGQVSVGPAADDADSVVQADHRVWDALVTGEAEPMSAFLRGSLFASGDAAMLIVMRRLFAVAAVPELTGQRTVVAAAGRGRL
jgi:putative sterol carrier protein